MSGYDWMGELRRNVSLPEALATLGTHARAGTRSYGPCPACKAPTRGSDDKRGPVSLTRDQLKWSCFACSVVGDVVDAIVASELGTVATRGMSEDQWRAVKERARSLGWLSEGPAEDHLPRAYSARERGRPPSAPSAPSHVAHDASNTPPEGSGGGASGAAPGGAPRGRYPFAWDAELPARARGALDTEAGEPVRAFLERRGIHADAQAEWALGAYVVREGEHAGTWLVIPLLDERGKLINIRFRSITKQQCPKCPPDAPIPTCGKCKGTGDARKYMVCPGRPMPLFGANRLDPDRSSEPLLVEGELEVIALDSIGIRNVVSTSAGAGAFPEAWLNLLEPYAGFRLCYDADGKGKEGAEKLMPKLGKERCSLIDIGKTGCKDICETREKGVPVSALVKLIDNPVPALGIEVCTVGAFEEDIERLISSPGELIGRPTGLPPLDAALGGLRPGLIVLSGESGKGKTSFATWMMFQQALMGIPTLITSFEQSPVGSSQKLLRAAVGNDFTRVSREERRAAIEMLDRLPLRLVKHRGEMDLADLIQVIRRDIRRHNTKNVLVDHLGFIRVAKAQDEREEIGVIMRQLSIISEQEGCSIILIAHPNNLHVAQGTRVTMASLKGSSNIRQDAHEVWIYEQTAGERHPGAVLHLDKIRSDFGTPGSAVKIAFDPLSVSFAATWAETPAGKRGEVAWSVAAV